MRLPALLARYKLDAPIVLWESEAVASRNFLPDFTLGNVTQNMGPDWQVWLEKPMQHPIGMQIRQQNGAGRPRKVDIELDEAIDPPEETAEAAAPPVDTAIL